MRLVPPALAALALSPLMALAACDKPEPAPAAPVAAAPVSTALPPGRPAVYAVQAEGPEPFIRALYAIYVAGGPKEPPPAAGQDPLYSRMMNATMGADVRVAKGEVPTLNYDLICGCQDQGVFTLDSLTVTPDGATKADAAVVFTNAGQTTRQTVKLVREGINWKVDDIVGADGKSIQQETIKVIEKAGG